VAVKQIERTKVLTSNTRGRIDYKGRDLIPLPVNLHRLSIRIETEQDGREHEAKVKINGLRAVKVTLRDNEDVAIEKTLKVSPGFIETHIVCDGFEPHEDISVHLRACPVNISRPSHS
jgi:hypothetical protein